MDKIYWNWLLFYNISSFFQTIHHSAPPLPSTMLFTVCDCPQHCIVGGGGMFYDRTSTVPNILSMIVASSYMAAIYYFSLYANTNATQLFQTENFFDSTL